MGEQVLTGHSQQLFLDRPRSYCRGVHTWIKRESSERQWLVGTNTQEAMLNCHIVDGLGKVGGEEECGQSDNQVKSRKEPMRCPTESRHYLSERHFSTPNTWVARFHFRSVTWAVICSLNWRKVRQEWSYVSGHYYPVMKEDNRAIGEGSLSPWARCMCRLKDSYGVMGVRRRKRELACCSTCSLYLGRVDGADSTRLNRRTRSCLVPTDWA